VGGREASPADQIACTLDSFPRTGALRLRECAALSERGTALRRGDMAAHYAPAGKMSRGKCSVIGVNLVQEHFLSERLHFSGGATRGASVDS